MSVFEFFFGGGSSVTSRFSETFKTPPLVRNYCFTGADPEPEQLENVIAQVSADFSTQVRADASVRRNTHASTPLAHLVPANFAYFRDLCPISVYRSYLLNKSTLLLQFAPGRDDR